MDLKIKEVADLLHVSETTIRRWLADGKIPAYRINQQYRFNRTEVEDWLIRQKQKDTQGHYPYKEENTEIDCPGNKTFSLYRAINKGTVIQDLPGDTKKQIIRTTMRQVASSMQLDAEVVTELLLERENLQPTALNNGIGIPHTRDFLLSSAHNVVTIVYPKVPLDYGALDGKPVHTLFFLFACNDRHHLHLLAKIAHFVSQPTTLDFLKQKPSKEDFLNFIKEWEGKSATLSL